MADKSLHDGHRERMRKRYRAAGSLEGFSEHEVLEMLLFKILPRVNTNETAHRLLKRFGSIRTVLSADITELCQVEGIGAGSAEQIAFMGQVFRLAERESYFAVQADDFESLRDYLIDFYEDDEKERLCAFSINSAGRITDCQILSVGKSDRVTLDIKELERFLAYNECDVLLLTHNHPFGSAMPSNEDIVLTRKLRNMLSGKIKLMDHVIVGDGEIVSMRAMGSFRAFES